MPLVLAYHDFEGIEQTAEFRSRAVGSLLANEALGGIWMIERGGRPIGYIALCFGYSIEFGGRDAFIDEFYIIESERGRGIGSSVLKQIRRVAAAHEVRALHLEVAEDNSVAQAFYARHYFTLRKGFHLMSAKIDQPV